MDKVGEQLPAMGTALAGLILVFMGVVLSSWDGYDAVAKKAVRPKYQRRAWLSFLGMLAALASAVFGLVAIGQDHSSPIPTQWGIACLATSAIFVVAVAIMTLSEI